MKKIKLSQKDIEALLWALEEHKSDVLEKLKTEEDMMIYRLLFDYNMHLRDLTDRLQRSIKSQGFPIKPRNQIID